MSVRSVQRVSESWPTIEGAGVRLRRAFGFGDTKATDPFLLLDDFRNDDPEAYVAGFPWHPHRGIETITYVLAGSVEHRDSMGNSGTIAAGDVQWMTAGRGIVHQEMPEGDAHGRMHGFQLWANLPKALKRSAPRYQEVKAGDIPLVALDGGARVRVVCGSFRGTVGPVEGVAADPIYLDVTVPADRRVSLPVEAGRNAFAYVFEGAGVLCGATEVGNRTLALFDDADEDADVTAEAGAEGMRFLFVSGKPLREPVAWQGPIVMNTEAELRQAFAELQQGTFLDPQDRR